MTIARLLVYALLLAAPLGTRYIFQMGEIGSVTVEYGTISAFGTQLIAAVAVFAAFFALRGRVRLTRPVLVAGGLALLAAASVSWAPDKGYAAVVAMGIIIGAMLLAAIATIRPDARVAAYAVITGAVLQAMIGLAQFFLQIVRPSTFLGIASHVAADPGSFVVETPVGRWLRAYGTLPHPNVFGAYLAVALLLTLSLRTSVISRRIRTALSVAIAVMGAGLFVSFSRSAVIGFVAGAAILVVTSHREVRRPRLLLSGFVIFAAVMAAFSFMYTDILSTRISGEGRLEAVSVHERVSLYEDALVLLREHPVRGVGVGVGQMPIALFQDHADGRDGWSYQPVHNAHALVAVELGILGVMLWVLLFGMAAVQGWRKRQDALTAGFLAALVTLGMIGLFDHFLWSLWQGHLLMWIVLSFTLNEYRLDTTPERA